MTASGVSDQQTAQLPLPPGPNLPAVLQLAMFPVRHHVVPRLRERYGDIFRFKMLGRPAVMLCNPEHNRVVFSGAPTMFHAGEGNVALHQVMGKHSVLTTDEDEHRRVRKLLMPPFHGTALRGYRGMITQLAADEVRRWPTGSTLAIHPRMNAVAMEVILRVVFGVADGPRLDALRRELSRLVSQPISVFLGEIVTSLQPYGPWRRFRELLARVDDLLYAEIADRRAATDLDGRTDVLSQLLAGGDPAEDGDRLSDAELRDQMITLLLAGHETTATTLAWTLHELSRNPGVQSKAADAAREGDEKYLENVVKESMRLHPVIFLVARRLTADLELGGYRIPKGHTVLPGIAPVHADPGQHAEPEVFRPERFADGSATPVNWLPFGGGVRRCLGAGFALLEATVILREILSRYHVTADRARPERTVARNITFAPSRGARVVLSRR